MTRPKSPSVASFAPQLLEVFKRAALSPFPIPLPSKAAATKLRQRLYSLRVALISENHPYKRFAQGTTLRIVENADKNKTVTLLCAPVDFEFAEAFQSAGIDLQPDEDLRDEIPRDFDQQIEAGTRGDTIEETTPVENKAKGSEELLQDFFNKK